MACTLPFASNSQTSCKDALIVSNFWVFHTNLSQTKSSAQYYVSVILINNWRCTHAKPLSFSDWDLCQKQVGWQTYSRKQLTSVLFLILWIMQGTFNDYNNRHKRQRERVGGLGQWTCVWNQGEKNWFWLSARWDNSSASLMLTSVEPLRVYRVFYPMVTVGNICS